MLWWDVRRLSEPTERLVLDLSRKENRGRALGAVSLEFEPTIVSGLSRCAEQQVRRSPPRGALTPA